MNLQRALETDVPPRSLTASRLQSLRATLAFWVQRARSRRNLRHALSVTAALSGGSALHDLGASLPELHWEARKPFWRA